MKSRISLTALLFLALTTGADAGTTDAYYDAVANKIIMPHLLVDGETYYATLSFTDVENLIFQLDVESITNFTPPAGIGVTVNTDVENIVGYWIPPGGSVSEFSILFRNDGSYSYFRGSDDGGCVAGEETGTYQWEPSTGVLLTTQTNDPNGSCGLSDPANGVPFRVFVDGNSLQLLENGGGDPLDSFGFQRAP